MDGWMYIVLLEVQCLFGMCSDIQFVHNIANKLTSENILSLVILKWCLMITLGN